MLKLLRIKRGINPWTSQRFCSSHQPSKQKVFSGIQPTGTIHIGNYLGAIQNWVNLQNSGVDVTFSIVDLHAITLKQDPDELRKNSLLTCASLLACGIDPTKSILFLQSSNHFHTELCWILECLTTMARLSHLPQYKEKSAKLKEIPLGLFVYPVLQAADILLYKTTHVPVGEDQVQHLQLAQHLAKLFNYYYGETFPICHAIIAKDASSRIKSLRDPTKKMSKSDPDPKSCLMITDTPDLLLEKCKKSVTDFTSAVTFDPQIRPGVSNLLTIHSLISGKSIDTICQESSALNTGQYKLKVAESLIEHLDPIRRKIEDYLKNPEFLWKVLEEGNSRAAEVAQDTMKEVKRKVGLGK
jgi:tryptophanyl-tRNA synthetase